LCRIVKRLAGFDGEIGERVETGRPHGRRNSDPSVIARDTFDRCPIGQESMPTSRPENLVSRVKSRGVVYGVVV
jgi:hypothetical protein